MANNSIQRAGKILALFDETRPLMGLSEMSRSLDLPRTTLHSLVQGLVVTGLLEKDPKTSKYRLGMELYALASTMISNHDLYRVSNEMIKRVSMEHSVTVRLILWHNGIILPIVTCQPNVLITMGPNLGPPAFAYSTAGGRILLAFMNDKQRETYINSIDIKAFTQKSIVTNREELTAELDKIRASEIAVNIDGRTMGRSACAAPVYNSDNEVIAALAITGKTNRFQENLEEMKDLTKETADFISREFNKS